MSPRFWVAVTLLLVFQPGRLVGEDRPPVELTERARRLHASTVLVDGHNDLPWAFRERGTPSFQQLDISQRQQQLHTDIPRLREGGVKVQFWSVYVPASTRLRGEALQTTLEQIDFVHAMVRQYPETFALCLSSNDIDQALAQGKIASLIGMEGGHSIENSLSVLQRLYKLGARYMTLTHAATLGWADSATDDPQHDGLTAFGEEVVREMNRLGMLVDLSHVSDATMRDAMRVSQAPIIYSHSSARAIANHPRNVPDDVLPLVAKNRGVIMVNFYSGFVVPEAAGRGRKREQRRQSLRAALQDQQQVDAELAKWEKRNPIPQGTIHDVVDHIDHLVQQAGIEHVGIGSDYDGIDAVPKQLEDVATFPLITQEMLNRGYTEADIRKVLGENVLRVFREAEQVAKRLSRK